jgi:hypothetical protein
VFLGFSGAFSFIWIIIRNLAHREPPQKNSAT